MIVHDFAGVFIVEEVPVAADWVAEGFFSGGVHSVKVEGAAGVVGDVEEGVFGEAGGVVVYEAGEEDGAPGVVGLGSCISSICEMSGFDLPIMPNANYFFDAVMIEYAQNLTTHLF